MDKQHLKQEFLSPGIAYRGKPFWSWNGELRGEELVRQAGIMKEMGLGGYFMHSRAGLITEYLSEEWFDLINQVADAAEKDGMEAWLYDEDRWPSGSAGGKVTVDPQYRMKSVCVFEAPLSEDTPREDTILLFLGKVDGTDLWAYRQIDIDTTDFSSALSALDLTEAEQNAPGEWKVLRFAIVPDPCNSNYNGTTYIDTMSRKATEKFIELTHEEYRKHCGDRLGRSIRGIFTDEPHRGHCLDDYKNENGIVTCSVCWTDDLFEEFIARYGYDPRPILPELYYRLNGVKTARIKHDYIDLANNLFLERFAQPILEWCHKNDMIFTGHVLHEDALMNQTICHGSLMRFYEFMDYPGVDTLSEHNRCYWIVKQLTSAARQLGQKWLLSELYGCTGWQFNFKSHKAVGDWQALFGINLRCQHLSWYTMEGQSKRDYPASILHQSPWYHDYATVEDYFARFGLVMSEGKPSCDVLVLNPIESVWCYAHMGWSKWLFSDHPDIMPYEIRYAETFHILAGNQIDFDYGEEQMMEHLASVEKLADGTAVLRVGEQRYRTVLVTNMLTMRSTTLKLLEEFMNLGGKVIFAGDCPSQLDAVPSDRIEKLSADGIRVPFAEQAIVDAVRAASEEFISVTNAQNEPERVIFAQMRKDFCGDGYALVLLNTDRDEPRKHLTVTMRVPSGVHLQKWNLETGKRTDADALLTRTEEGVSFPVSLEAAGTACFVLTPEQEALPTLADYETVSERVIDGTFSCTRDEANVCVLDWLRWRWQGGEFSDEMEALKADQAVRDTLGLEHRGGEMLQPWFSKLHDTKQYGELELEYTFEIDTLPTGEVWLAGERPEWNHYRINGVSLTCEDINDFWVDECFKKMRIPDGVLKTGKNTVTVNVTFLRTTNIEALYLIGEFGVAIDGRRRTLVALPEAIGCENFEQYNLPFYTGAMTYHIPAERIKGLQIADDERVVLTPVQFTGGCAKVTAAGKTTVLGWEPYEADVTEAVRAGEAIDVTVVGTRRNVFGPLHQAVRIASAYGPGNFVTTGDDWTDDYSLIDSGLRGIALKVQKKR